MRMIFLVFTMLGLAACGEDIDSELQLACATYFYTEDDRPSPAIELRGAQEPVGLADDARPFMVEALVAWATSAIHEGDPDAALVLIETALAGAPQNGEAWWLKGQALMQQGKLKDARDAFDRSIEYSNVASANRITRALVNVQLLQAMSARITGNTAEALALTQLAFQQTSPIQTVMELTEYQKVVGHPEAIGDALQEWLRAYPNDVPVRLMLTYYLEHNNDNSGAQTQ